ncbi:hypothetical protein [Streptomyces sp. NPDC056660]|uniref:hypothetical protein n=1 Tax=Streptomyces sp. NPDC056660 TaxID=3345897 RepID=UPI0036A216CA
MGNRLLVKGAGRQGLRGVSAKFHGNPRFVFEGVSGSDKSSRASDSVFTEGRPRHMESLPAYAGKILGQLDEPTAGPHDRLIGMGPEGGHRGGQVIAAGTPEQIAAHPGSHTGGYLGALLEETL